MSDFQRIFPRYRRPTPRRRHRSRPALHTCTTPHAKHRSRRPRRAACPLPGPGRPPLRRSPHGYRTRLRFHLPMRSPPALRGLRGLFFQTKAHPPARPGILPGPAGAAGFARSPETAPGCCSFSNAHQPARSAACHPGRRPLHGAVRPLHGPPNGPGGTRLRSQPPARRKTAPALPRLSATSGPPPATVPPPAAGGMPLALALALTSPGLPPV